MISPAMQVEAEIHIHAARGTVWRHFTNVADWPHWRNRIVSASWQGAQPWSEGGTLKIESLTLWGGISGGSTTYNAVVRMSVPENTVVWEQDSVGYSVVTTAQLRDDLGGCSIFLRQTYHGHLTFFLRLWRAGIQRQLAAELTALKAQIERK